MKAFDDWMFDRVFQPAINRFPDASPVECGRFFLMGAMFTAFFGMVPDPSFTNVALQLVSIGACSYMYFAAGRMRPSRGRNPMRIAPMCCPTRVYFVAVVACGILSCAAASPSIGSIAHLAFNIAMLLSLYAREARSAKPGRLAYAGV